MPFTDQIETLITALESSSPEEIRQAISHYEPADLIAVLVKLLAGGGSFPDTWTFDAATGALTIDSSASDVTIPVRVLAGSGATVGFDIRFDPALPGIRLEGLDAPGKIALTDDYSGTQTLLLSGTISVQGGADAISVSPTSVVTAGDGTMGYFEAGTFKDLAKLSPKGVKIGVNSAPADADLDAGTAYLWLDSTNGAAKLMVKAKQADGTVKTGSLDLA